MFKPPQESDYNYKLSKYNFRDLHAKVKYEEFYERSYVEEFHANCLVSKTRRDFLCARNW